MKFLYKLEKKFGKYAIKNLTAIIVGCFVFSYILSIFAPQVYQYVIFSPYHIFYEHQYWRIFTWILTNPGNFDFLTLLMLFFYYSIGSTVEKSLGSFLYNLYIFGGMFITTVSCLLTGLYYYIQGDQSALYLGTFEMLVNDARGIGLTSIMLQSVFFGFALIFSEAVVLIYFLIPFKVKYLALIEILLLGYEFMNAGSVIGKVAILASVANFLIFYFVIKKYRSKRMLSFSQLKKKKQMRRFKVVSNNDFVNKNNVPQTITRHKCAICGKSEKDDPELEFRFCSKCNGNYEYCSEHLYTHEHVK